MVKRVFSIDYDQIYFLCVFAKWLAEGAAFNRVPRLSEGGGH